MSGRGRMRGAVLGLSVVGLVLAGCSSSGGESAATSTTVATTVDAPASTTETPTTEEPASETTVGEDATTTTIGSPVSTTTPSATPGTPEELAVAFVRAATLGEDLSPFVRDNGVAAEASSSLEAGSEAAAWEFSMEPDYVDPLSQGGEGGDCQLIGDVTLTCAVLIGRPATDDMPDPSYSLWAVQVTNIDPNATSPDDPLPPVPYYVVAIEGLAG
jgi:hypothetical protein